MKAKTLMPKITITVIMFAFFFAITRIYYGIDKTGMATPILFNVAIGIVSLLGLSVLSLVHTMDKASNDKDSKLFLGMIVLAYFGIIFDNLSWIIDGSAQYRELNIVLNTGGFLVNPIIMVLFWNYQNVVFIGESKTSDRLKKVINILAFVDVTTIIISSATGFLFTIDANGRYDDGKGMVLSYAYPVFVVACCIFENLRRQLPIKKKLSLLAFGLAPIVTMIFLIPLEQYSFVYVVFFIDLILIYGTVHSQKGIELAEKSKELTEKQTQIMVSQIQPHFLYNTLTAIYQLCDIDTELAQKTILDFSTYLRANMDGIKSTEPIPFEKELDHTKTYLAIEMLRFSDILSVEYNVEATDFMIPALTLQPLVENAVKYGIRSREDGGTVTISTKRENSKIYISVHDDGMGFNVNVKKSDDRSHTGIDNTRQRLKLMMNADLVVESEIGIGTTATIILEDKNEPTIS